MATAPTPGQARTDAERDLFRRSGIVLTWGPENDRREYVLNLGDLGPGDDVRSRKETGFPVSSFFSEDRFGADSVLVLLWMARVKGGEDRLRFAQVLAEYPTFASIAAQNPQIEELTDETDVVDVDSIELVGSSPE